MDTRLSESLQTCFHKPLVSKLLILFRLYDRMSERSMSNEISEEKLKEAKEKLACHIRPPEHKSENSSSQAASSCSSSGAQADFIDENGKVLLTRMTSAGG